ncbi:MAG: VUT family protein [Burkholderiales bacterium]|nr:VUT family protein [Burkholderiales bacterium]
MIKFSPQFKENNIKQKLKQAIFFVLFLSMIPLAGYAIRNIGTCTPNVPCIIPVWTWPYIYAPSGVLFAGLAFVFRDILQRLTNIRIAIIAVIIGTILNYILVDGIIAIAGATAYLISETTDTIIYSLLQKYNLILAILISALFGLVIDTLVFLQMAFHSLDYADGQIIGKLWMVLLSIPIIKACRKYI